MGAAVSTMRLGVARTLRREARRLAIRETRLRLDLEATREYAEKLEAIAALEITDEVMARVLGQAAVDRLNGPSFPKPLPTPPVDDERLA